MKKAILIAIIFTIFPSYAEQIATTEEGRRVLLKNDGTYVFMLKKSSITPVNVRLNELLFEEDFYLGKTVDLNKSYNGYIVWDENKKPSGSIYNGSDQHLQLDLTELNRAQRKALYMRCNTIFSSVGIIGVVIKNNSYQSNIKVVVSEFKL
jgi:hypothetical protein